MKALVLGDIVDPSLVDLIFDPSFGGMHCVAFASGSGTNFKEAVLGSREPGSNFSLDYLLTDKSLKTRDPPKVIGALEYAMQLRVPADVINGFEVCGSWEAARQSEEGKREYARRCGILNALLLEKVAGFEGSAGFVFDLAILAGYMRLVKDPLWRRFYNRMINVHPARLDVLGGVGARKFVGDRAVYDALCAGEQRTRSSIIIVDRGVDTGAILVSGPWVEYKGSQPVTQDSADAHQALQKQRSDWPALRFALRAIAHGELGLHRRKFHSDGNPIVVYKGREMPYQGVELPLEEAA